MAATEWLMEWPQNEPEEAHPPPLFLHFSPVPLREEVAGSEKLGLAPKVLQNLGASAELFFNIRWPRAVAYFQTK